jgi:S1-C subfamily serine protease
VIVAVDGRPVSSTEQLIETIDSFSPGQTVTLEIRRGGRVLTLRVRLGTRPQTLPSG